MIYNNTNKNEKEKTESHTQNREYPIFNAGSSDPVNVELNQPLDRI
jgi:hypothetical protein